MYSKVSAANNNEKAKFANHKNLKFNDILCVVCQTILKEPVYLPCDHGFCLTCFELIVQKNDLNCPCCRKRFATWLRKTNSTSTTPGGSSCKPEHLVDQKLWKVIKNQFANQLNVDERSLADESPGNITPQESIVPIDQPGEIRKDFESQLQQYQNELIEKEKKEDSTTKDYIIDLYRQESVINLVDSPSENRSSSSSSSSSSTSGTSTYSSPLNSDNSNSNMLLAQPGPSSYHNQSRPDTSNGSIISISSTSSPASTSAASSRYSLIKSVTQQISRGTEIIKQTVQNSFLGKLTKARLKEHEKSNVLLNKNVMTVKPTKIHRAPSHCSSDGNDSLKSDTNYFKPILPSPTKVIARPLLRVPSVKVDMTMPPSNSKELRLAKSSHQLLSPITLKNSAFSIFNEDLACEFAEQLKPLAPVVDPAKEMAKSEPNRRGRKRKNTNSEQSVKPETEKPIKVSKMAKIEMPSNVRVTRRSNCNNFNNNSGERLNCDLVADSKKAHILQEIMLDQRKCEAMIEQERKDFEYAKKLQSQLNRQQRTPKYSANYSLRRKSSNLQNEDSVQMGDCRKAVQVVERMGTRRSARNKC